MVIQKKKLAAAISLKIAFATSKHFSALTLPQHGTGTNAFSFIDASVKNYTNKTHTSTKTTINHTKM